jgi:hypothetical protein
MRLTFRDMLSNIALLASKLVTMLTSYNLTNELIWCERNTLKRVGVDTKIDIFFYK